LIAKTAAASSGKNLRGKLQSAQRRFPVASADYQRHFFFEGVRVLDQRHSTAGSIATPPRCCRTLRNS
jgi:hypothetical protein